MHKYNPETEEKQMPKSKKNDASEFYPSALTIAGSDSGGGAGIQTDLRTFNAYGVFGCSVITAVTAQNPLRVTRVDAIPPEGVEAQLRAVLEAIPVKAVKSGMLFQAETVSRVAALVKEFRLKLICDPVMVATSGAVLLEKDAIEAVREELLPVVDWVTPNLPEAELLLGTKLASKSDYDAAAKAIHERWGVSVLLKTGHDEKAKNACDVICRQGKIYHLTSPKTVFGAHASHGTGCTLSAAIAAGFALGFPWKQALCEAKAFVLGSLKENINIGKDLFAMYPPTEDNIQLVKLEETGGK